MTTASHHCYPLNRNQIDTFLRDGVLVVDDVLTEEELRMARRGLHSTLMKYDIDPDNLWDTAHNLRHVSSTNGSGGVLDIFYPAWKMELSCHPKFFSIISQLWKATFHDYSNNNNNNNSNNSNNNNNNNDHLYEHPYGDFRHDRGFVYIDRIGFRIPTIISKQVGAKIPPPDNDNNDKTKHNKKTRKNRPIQRSLTPHLDCCPHTILNTNNNTNNNTTKKWRPFQSFISLTDNTQPSTGGFEAARGFHHDFKHWATSLRPPSIVKKKDGTVIEKPPPCVGEYTPIRPLEDDDELRRVQHVSCRAGSVVIWDNRIPHANSFVNDDGDLARSVVYASFLPDVDVNRQYVAGQLRDYERRRIPMDQWVEIKGGGEMSCEDEEGCVFSPLGRKLMGIDCWEDDDCNAVP